MPGEGLGDIPYAEADHRPAGMGLREGADATRDVGEQVRGLELRVVLVYSDDCLGT